MAQVESRPKLELPATGANAQPTAPNKKKWVTRIAALGTTAVLAFTIGQLTGSEEKPATQNQQTQPDNQPKPNPEAPVPENLVLPEGVNYTVVELPVAEIQPGDPEGSEVVRTAFLTRWEAFKTNNAYLLEQNWLGGSTHEQFQADLQRMGETPDPTRVDNPDHLVIDSVLEFEPGNIEAQYHLEADGETYQASIVTLRLNEEINRWQTVWIDSLE